MKKIKSFSFFSKQKQWQTCISSISGFEMRAFTQDTHKGICII